jgi:hypothetical protein
VNRELLEALRDFARHHSLNADRYPDRKVAHNLAAAINASLAAEGDGAGKEQPNDAVARIAKAVDMRGVADLAKIAANVEGLRQKYNEMCDRLHKAVDYHNLGLGGEHVDVLVIEALNQSAADCAALRAELKEYKRDAEVQNQLDLARSQLAAAIAERDALREKIDKGHRGYVRPCTHGLLVVEVPKCWSLDSRVRVLLEGE